MLLLAAARSRAAWRLRPIIDGHLAHEKAATDECAGSGAGEVKSLTLLLNRPFPLRL